MASFDEKLVCEIQKYEFIFNKKLKEYRNKIRREKAWVAIAEATGETKEGCQSRWKSLRDKFVRESNIKKKSGSGAADEEKQWAFADNMMFLKDHIAPRRTVSKNEIENGIFSEEIENALLFTSGDNILSNPEEIASIPMETNNIENSEEINMSSSVNRKRKRNTSDADASFSSFLGKVENIITTNFSTRTNNNAPFLEMLDGYLKNLNEQQQEILKIDILNFTHNRCNEIRLLQ